MRGRFTHPTNQTCHVCGHVDNKSDQLGTHSICNQEFHVDINAAFSNRFPCMGRQSVSSGGNRSPPNRRRQGGNNGDKPKPGTVQERGSMFSKTYGDRYNGSKVSVTQSTHELAPDRINSD